MRLETTANDYEYDELYFLASYNTGIGKHGLEPAIVQNQKH